MRRIRQAGSRRSVRRTLIGALLAVPVVVIATTMPMQAMGNPVSPATTGGSFLTLQQEDSADPVTEGDQVTYAVTVGVDAEQSTSDATNVETLDYLSPDVDFVSAEADFAECSYNSESNIVTCDFGNMFEDQSFTAYITVQTTDRCTGGGDLVAFSLSEPCVVDNYVEAYADNATNSGTSSDEFTTVNPAAGPNLHISKSDDPDPVQELNPITYTIDVNNTGSTNATNTTVVDHLPPGTTFVSAKSTQGNCTHTPTVVTCHLGTLVASEGGGETVTIVVQAPNVTEDTVIENAAGVSASNADSADTTEDTTVLVNDGGSTSGTVPPNSPTPLTFTTGTQSAGGQTVVNGSDKTAVSIVVPKGGPGGNVSLDEVACPTAPCTGAAAARDTAAQQAATAKIVLGGVAFDVVPPDNYPNNKPFKVTMLWDKTLNGHKSPVFYFKQGVTPTEITLPHCGQTPPNSGKPCVIKNEKITSGPAIALGDWKVVVRINSDPRMRK
jgi:uncharacterized repeat protein (TIGR01451 family)